MNLGDFNILESCLVNDYYVDQPQKAPVYNFILVQF